MGEDAGIWRIGPYSRKGLSVGVVLGAILLAMSLFFIRYTDRLFLVVMLWIVALPFVMWVVRRLRSGEPPD